MSPEPTAPLVIVVNGVQHRIDDVPVRMTLADLLRRQLRLTGTHVGCEQGACGSCTVLLNDRPVRSCLVLAPQAAGCSVTTVEGLREDPTAQRLCRALDRTVGAQCGFCTTGIVVSLTWACRAPAKRDPWELLDGHICRCTGYQPIKAALDSCLRPAAEDEAP